MEPVVAALDSTATAAIAGTVGVMFATAMTTMMTLLLRRSDRKERKEIRDEVAAAAAQAKADAALLAERQEAQLAAAKRVADLMSNGNTDTAERLERIDAQGEATHSFLNSQDTDNKRATLLLTEGWLVSLRAEQATRKKAGLRAEPGTTRQIKLLAAQVTALRKVIEERVAQGKAVDAQVAAAEREAAE